MIDTLVPINIDEQFIVSVVDLLIQNHAFQRLKNVHLNGGDFLICPHITTTRFQYCLSIAKILSDKGASQEEIIAVLLHDSGHGPFNYFIDHIVTECHEIYQYNYVIRIEVR